MKYQPIGRSFYAVAACGALLVAGGTASLVASARQSPPSPTQAKKAAQTVPSTTNGKQTPLPGFNKSSDSHSDAASPAGTVAQQKATVFFQEGTGDAKTGIAKGQGVVYTEGDMKFTGQTAVYNRNTQELDAQGNLDLDDPKHHVTGDKSHVDRKKQLATIKGNVVITLKPTPPDPNLPPDPDTAKQRKYPVIITCDRADDSYKKDFIVLNGHLLFKQTIMKDNGKTVERTLTAEHAEYDGKTNTLHLFEPVKAYDSEGQKSDFEKDVFVGTKEGEETLTSPGKAKIIFNLDDDDAATGDKSSTDKQTTEKKPPEKKDTPPPSAPKQPN
ncbi:MAG: LPS-assembly protein LptD [Chthonomonadaceae bacterium]|nr:LPS-assembly protein LptD [Chthonomonadaceae bacterium]